MKPSEISCLVAIIVFTIAISLVLICTPLVQSFGQRLRFFDQPGRRKVHQSPIVRVGGIAICAGTLIAILSIVLLPGKNLVALEPWLPIIGLILGSFVFFIIGLSDDILQLSPFIRLLLQGIIVALVWFLGVRVDYLPLPFLGTIALGFWSLPITFLWIAGVANAINWIDGLDGLAAGISAIAALVLTIVCWQTHHPITALSALALAGATLGFLRYNANPAQIFMGDGGSYFIGFVLAASSAIGLMQEPSFSLTLLPFLILAVPLADMTRVIAVRLFNGKSPFIGDQNHLHHRFLKAGLSVKTVVSLMYNLIWLTGSWAIVLAGVPAGWIAIVIALFSCIATSQSLWHPFLAKREKTLALTSSTYTA